MAVYVSDFAEASLLSLNLARLLDCWDLRAEVSYVRLKTCRVILFLMAGIWKKINQSGFRWKTVRALGKDLIVQETKRKSEHRITAAAGLVTINVATATVLFREGALCCGPCCFWKSLTVIGLSWTSCSSCIWDVKTGCGATGFQTV